MNGPTYDAIARSKVVHDYAEAFHRATGFALRLAPAKLKARRVAYGRQGNPFCELVADCAGGCRACLKIQTVLQRRLSQKLAPQQVRCPAGLTDVAVPVLVNGEHVATLFGGQAFRQKPRRRDFERAVELLKSWGRRHGWKRVERVYFQTPTVTQEQFHAMIRLLAIFAQQLGESVNRWMVERHNRDPRHVAQIKKFVHAHFNERLTMQGTARHVGLSPYYFCRMFKKATGLTFTEYVCRVRIEKVKVLLTNQASRIGEAALEAGFHSIPHFDRMFRRYTGMTPHEYRSCHLRGIAASAQPKK